MPDPNSFSKLRILSRTVPVIEVTETLPSGKNYVQWMVDQLSQIKAALKK